MLFKDHDAYDPEGAMWKSIGGPVCPMCVKELLPDEEVEEFEGFLGVCLTHSACIKDPTITSTWMPEPEVPDFMGAFNTKPLQGHIHIPSLFNSRHDNAPIPDDKIEVPLYAIDPKTGEKIESGSVTINKEDFHTDNPEFKPSPVADNLKDLFNDSPVQGDEDA